jgi:hypothetical protein
MDQGRGSGGDGSGQNMVWPAGFVNNFNVKYEGNKNSD